MDAAVIQALLGAGPIGLAALAIWFGLKKDAQNVALMERLAELAKVQATSSLEVKTALDGLRDAIRVGLRN